MNLTKVSAALATAQQELNTVVDGEFQSRRQAALRPLTLAQSAITLAETHLTKAAARVAPKASTTAQAESAAVPAKGKGK